MNDAGDNHAPRPSLSNEDAAPVLSDRILPVAAAALVGRHLRPAPSLTPAAGCDGLAAPDRGGIGSSELTRPRGEMTVAVSSSARSEPIPDRSDQMEAWLRRFRARELAKRQRPTAVWLAVDAASRVAPMAAGYAGMILLAFPYHLLAAAVFAVATISILGSWFHDGVHNNIRAPFSQAMKRLGSSPVGFSPRWWLLKHLRLHHRYPGNPAFDPDIQFGHIARISPAQPWQRSHATQHIHMWFLYPFATLNMLKPDEPMLTRRYSRLLGLNNPTPAWVLLVDKYIPPTLVWTPVFLAQPGLGGLQTFVAFHLVAGTLASLITQVQHNTTLSSTVEDYSSRWPLCEQLMRTTDVGSTRGLWWWLCGGVNFHVAHHLAPTLSFLELPAVTTRLRRDLRELGIELPAHSGVAAAIRSHATLLRELSRRTPAYRSPPTPTARPS